MDARVWFTGQSFCGRLPAPDMEALYAEAIAEDRARDAEDEYRAQQEWRAENGHYELDVEVGP